MMWSLSSPSFRSFPQASPSMPSKWPSFNPQCTLSIWRANTSWSSFNDSGGSLVIGWMAERRDKHATEVDFRNVTLTWKQWGDANKKRLKNAERLSTFNPPALLCSKNLQLQLPSFPLQAVPSASVQREPPLCHGTPDQTNSAHERLTWKIGDCKRAHLCECTHR